MRFAKTMFIVLGLCLLLDLFVIKVVPVKYHRIFDPLKHCLISMNDNPIEIVSIGTSVLRESVDHNKPLNSYFSRSTGFNCGLSAPTTNISFHASILYAMLDRELAPPKVFLAVSVQDLLSENTLEVSKIGIGALRTPTLLGLMRDQDMSVSNGYWFMLIKSILFPLVKLGPAHKPEMIMKMNTGRNVEGYRQHTYSTDNLKEGELDMLQQGKSLLEVMGQLELLRVAADRQGIKLDLLFLPLNEDYLSTSIPHSEIALIYDTLFSQFPGSLDFRYVVSSAGFADCCHLNDAGRAELAAVIDD